MSDTITVHKFGECRGISYMTARRWALSGKLGPISYPPGKSRPMLLDMAELRKRGLWQEEPAQIAFERAIEKTLESLVAAQIPLAIRVLKTFFDEFVGAGEGSASEFSPKMERPSYDPVSQIG